MAYQISNMAAAAFHAGRRFSLSNTLVDHGALYLHGNKIAWHDPDNNNICFCLCGWDSRTTCERLRALGLNINHKRGKLYLDNTLIGDYMCYQITNSGDLIQL